MQKQLVPLLVMSYIFTIKNGAHVRKETPTPHYDVIHVVTKLLLWIFCSACSILQPYKFRI